MQRDEEILCALQDPTQRQAVIHAYAKAISKIWLVNCPLAGVGLIMVFFVRHYTLKRNTVQQASKKDIEAGAGDVPVGDEDVDHEKQTPKESGEATREGTLRGAPTGTDEDVKEKIAEEPSSAAPARTAATATRPRGDEMV